MALFCFISGLVTFGFHFWKSRQVIISWLSDLADVTMTPKSNCSWFRTHQTNATNTRRNTESFWKNGFGELSELRDRKFRKKRATKSPWDPFNTFLKILNLGSKREGIRSPTTRVPQVRPFPRRGWSGARGVGMFRGRGFPYLTNHAFLVPKFQNVKASKFQSHQTHFFKMGGTNIFNTLNKLNSQVSKNNMFWKHDLGIRLGLFGVFWCLQR